MEVSATRHVVHALNGLCGLNRDNIGRTGELYILPVGFRIRPYGFQVTTVVTCYCDFATDQRHKIRPSPVIAICCVWSLFVYPDNTSVHGCVTIERRQEARQWTHCTCLRPSAEV
jgi:hypothetical protein